MLKKRIISLLAAFIIAASLCMPCFAAINIYSRPDISKNTSMEIYYHHGGTAFSGVNFKLYKIADMDTRVRFNITERFASYPIAFKSGMTNADWANMAETLAGYVNRDNLSPDLSGQTGSDGKLQFAGLGASLYLVMGGSYTSSSGSKGTTYETHYHTAPFLLSVPYTKNGEWQYDVSTNPKFTSSTSKYITKRVLKVWDDKGHEEERPDSLTFDLVRNNKVFKTIKLTAKQSWRYQWTELDNRYEWYVVERESEKYTVSGRQEGLTYIVTNQYKSSVTPPPEGETPTPPISEVDDPETPTIKTRFRKIQVQLPRTLRQGTRRLM